MKRFVEAECRDQSVLFPERLDDWIADDNPVRAVDAFVDELDVAALGFEGAEPADLEVRPRHLNHGWSQLRLTSVPPDGQQLSFEAGIPAFELRLQDESFGLPDAGAVLQLARPATAVPWQDGDVTIVTRSYRLQP